MLMAWTKEELIAQREQAHLELLEIKTRHEAEIAALNSTRLLEAAKRDAEALDEQLRKWMLEEHETSGEKKFAPGYEIKYNVVIDGYSEGEVIQWAQEHAQVLGLVKTSLDKTKFEKLLRDETLDPVKLPFTVYIHREVPKPTLKVVKAE